MRNPTLYDLIQAHVKSGEPHGGRRAPAPRLVCADGFHMSLQASEYHYSTPRDDVGPYTEFEVWCCSAHEPALDPWGDGDDPYAYVPLRVVEHIIAKHGGFASHPHQSSAPARQEWEGVVRLCEQEGGYAAPSVDLETDDNCLSLTDEFCVFDGRRVRIVVEEV